MKARSCQQIHTNNKSRKDDDPSVDADVLRRQREEAFRQVGFSTLAEQAVNGYTTTQYPATHEITSHPTAHSYSDHSLTPPIEISNDLDNRSGNSSGDEFKKEHPTLLPPEAGLHRDGEQARLVEVVRRRQLHRQKKHEQTAFEWLEEMLFNGGFIGDSRTARSSDRNIHSTMPLNPYRDPGQASKHPTSNHDPIRVPQSIQNDQLLPSQPSPPAIILSKYPFLHHVLTKLLRAFRWFIDCCITRIAGLEPLQSKDAFPIYSTAPAYSFQISADDIIHFLVVLWATFYSGIQMQVFAIPIIVMTSVLLGSAGRKVVRRMNSVRNQCPMSQQQVAKIDAVSNKILPVLLPIPNSTTDGTVRRLQKLYPNATIAECKRFFACVKYNEEAASKRMEEFFRWRSECGLKSIADACGERSDDRHVREFDQAFVEKDAEDWNASAQLAISIVTKSHVPESAAKLPQIICSYEEKFEEGSDSEVLPKQKKEFTLPPRCKDGTRILHILPFRLDLSIATAPTYSLAVALYLDRRLSRLTIEKITLLCDVRGGRGWANPTPWSTLPFIQSTASLLGSHYPERLERLVLFPMPMSAIWVWSAAKKCLDPNTSSKVVIVSPGEGSAPPEQLLEFVDDEKFSVLEKRRQSFFHE
ncbi:hypothetical protein ACHAXA_000728 [Cyclostephanos tholiformis]|uniref:CRAL-TRIO domain-containing protein n=1 Tax=Cyclostephanos tholiformis TaxID=382380 RepID=A0ABD3R866_9STRA